MFVDVILFIIILHGVREKWTPKQIAIIQQNLVRFVFLWNFKHANFETYQ